MFPFSGTDFDISEAIISIQEIIGKGKKNIRKAVKVLIWIIVGLAGLLVVISILLRLHPVQNYAAQKAVNYLRNKTNTEIKLDKIAVTLPDEVTLEGIYFEDMQQDTLLYTRQITADVSLFELMRNNIHIDKLAINGLSGQIKRTLPDSTFNFNFIITSLTGDKKPQPQPDTTKRKPPEVSVGRIQLSEINATFYDEVGGVEAGINLGELIISMDEVNLAGKKILIDHIDFSNTKGYFNILKSVESGDTTSPEFAYQLGLKSLDFKAIGFRMHNKPDSTKMALNVGALELQTNQMDFKNKYIDFEQFSLAKSSFSLYRHQAPAKLQDSKAPKPSSLSDESTGWTVLAETLKIDESGFSMHNQSTPEKAGQLDPEHLEINRINSNLQKVYFNPDSISARIENLTMAEHNGFEIRRFRTNVLFTDQQARLEDLKLETTHSLIRESVKLDYPSLAYFTKHPQSGEIDIHLKNAQIGFDDLAYFQPDIIANLPVNTKRAGPLTINTRISGKLSDLQIAAFETKLGDHTRIKLSGSAHGLPEIENTFIDLNLDTVFTTATAIQQMIIDTLIPSGITIPDTIMMSGRFEGTLADFSSKADIQTSLGQIDATMVMNQQGLENSPHYKGSVNMSEMQLGTLLQQPGNFGALSMQLNFDGSGMQTRDMNAHVDATISRAEFNRYTYSNITLAGNYQNSRIKGNLQIEDSNIVVSINGLYRHDTLNPRYKATINVEAANLQAINLTEKDTRVKGMIKSDFSGSTLQNLNGEVAIYNTLIVHQKQLYPVDSLLMVSLNEKGQSRLTVDSKFLQAEFEGNIPLNAVPNTLQYHFDEYLAERKIQREDLPPQSFTFKIELLSSDLLEDIFIPGLNTLETGIIEGKYNSDEKKLDITADIPYLNYKGNIIDSLNLYVKSGSSNLNAGITVEQLEAGPVSVNRIGFNSTIKNDSLYMNYSLKNEAEETIYLIGGNLIKNNNAYVFSLTPGKLLLDSTSWDIPPDNFIRFREGYMQAKNLNISKADQEIAFITSDTDSIATFNFKDFPLAAFLNMLKTDYQQSLVNGSLSGNLRISQKTRGGLLESDMELKSMRVIGESLGDMNLKVNRRNRNTYSLRASLKGNNDLTLRGDYQLAEPAQIDLETDIGRLNLAAARPFTYRYLDNLQGNLSGNITIKGKTASPTINGDISFNNTRFFVKSLGNTFSLNKETVVFDNQSIDFESFVIKDKEGQPLAIKGNILHSNFTNLSFGLEMDADDFMLMNSTAKQNEMMYGTLVINSNASVGGDINNPVVDATISVEDETDMNYAIPKTTPASVSEEGVVEFIQRQPKLDSILMVEEADTTTMNIGGMELSANIEIMPGARFKIIIDEQTGDYLTVRGDANLSMTMTPAGGLSLTGRYDINRGHYKAALFGLTTKKFNIQDGSYIYWTGNPMDAQMSIIAEYRVSTSPLNLVAGQVENLSQATQNQYKQELPFTVQLNIAGNLEKPEISFALSMPPDQRNAMNGVPYKKIQQLNQPGNQSALNKQVLSLLAFNTFLPENPLEMEGGGSISRSARTSVSRVLSKQLNQMANRYIKGVQLDIGVESYEEYTAGGETKGRTQLDVGVEKNLFNDRLIVKVGGSIDVEGEKRQQQQGFKDIAGDLSVAYKLTPDGRFRVKAYSYEQYEQFAGDITESGVSIILVRDFNQLRQLFGILNKKTEDEKKIDQEKNEH
ncbi:MAG: translocation/assembly module TamB domain-containing protein [Bacteroidales bacterium]|nr:translocation/assembly module TamB domain-containing protein [Bacteroidales bacterium]